MRNQTPTKMGTQGCEGMRFDGLKWKERVPLFDNPTCSTGGTAQKEDEDIRGRIKISRDAEDMLIRVKRKQLIITALYKELGLSGYKGQRCKQELLRSGLVDEVEIPTNKRGRRMKLLQVTPKGSEYLKALGVESGGKGRGGAKHVYYQQKLKDWYQARGCRVEIEASVGGTCLDVLVVRKDGSRLGIEIAMSEQYEVVNASKAMKAGIEDLLFLCESKSVVNRLTETIRDSMPNQIGSAVRVELVSNYLTRG